MTDLALATIEEDSVLAAIVKKAGSLSFDERMGLLDGVTDQKVMQWICTLRNVGEQSLSLSYEFMYSVYLKQDAEGWSKAVRDIATATGRPAESLRKNFNKWVARHDMEVSSEHQARREAAERGLASTALLEEPGNDSPLSAGDDFDEWDDDIPVDEVQSFLQDEEDGALSEADMDEYLAGQLDDDELLNPPDDGKRTPLTVAAEEASRLKAEWIAKKAASLGDHEFSQPAAASAAEKLTSNLDGGVPFEEWSRGTIGAYEQSGYDYETSEKKAEVDWWKRQLKNHGFVEEAIKPDSVTTKPKKDKAPPKPKTNAAKLERAMEMVREVIVDLKERGVVAEDRTMVGTCQSMAYSLKSLETLIKGDDTPQQAPKAPATSKSAPADWKPPSI